MRQAFHSTIHGMSACLPRWHTWIASVPKTRIYSGYSIVNGNVPSSPENLRAKAAAAISRGFDRLTLDEYSVARYIASEVGSGTPEEKVAVAEAGINHAKKVGVSVSRMLLTARNPANNGYYGPINVVGPSDISAPYGRWAATTQDPTLQDIVIARFVLSGGTKNFSRYADDQNGPNAFIGKYGVEYYITNSIKRLANSRSYWVGYLAGVDHFHTFLYRTRKDVAPTSTLGMQLVAQAAEAIRAGKSPTWSSLSVCPKSGSYTGPLFVAASIALAGGIVLWTQRDRLPALNSLI